LEKSIKEMLARAWSEYRVIDGRERARLEVLKCALAAVATVTSELRMPLPEEQAAGGQARKHDRGARAPLATEKGAPSREQDDGEGGGTTAATAATAAAAATGKKRSQMAASGRSVGSDGSASDDEDSPSDDEPSEGSHNGGKVADADEGFGANLLGTCEIWWNGKVETTVFPLPLEHSYLTKKTKREFMKNVRIR
jgi:hypothetical protein